MRLQADGRELFWYWGHMSNVSDTWVSHVSFITDDLCSFGQDPCSQIHKNTTMTLSDVSRHRGWSPRFSSKEFFTFPRKESTIILSSSVSFKQQHHPKRKPLVPRDNTPAWVQRGKHWLINPHLSTAPTGTSLAAWVHLSPACFSLFSHIHHVWLQLCLLHSPAAHDESYSFTQVPLVLLFWIFVPQFLDSEMKLTGEPQ